MKNASTFWIIAAVAAGTVNLSNAFGADVLYSTMQGNYVAQQTAEYTFTPYQQYRDPNDSNNIITTGSDFAIGDDFNTGFTSIYLTSISFYGGGPQLASGNSAGDRSTIYFYDSTGDFEMTKEIYFPESASQGIGYHTYQLSSPEVLKGSGYFAFNPNDTIYFNGATGQETVHPPGPATFQAYFGAKPTIGSSSAANAAISSDEYTAHTIDSMATYGVPGYMQVEFDGFGISGGLLGDCNGDGRVDLNDLNIVLNNLGITTYNRTQGNFDGAATIDLNDLNDVLNNLGVVALPTTSPPQSPSPKGFWLPGTFRSRHLCRC